MVVVNKMNPVHAKREMNSGVNNVEQAGFIPTNVRIEEFFKSGRILTAARREAFDFAAGEKVNIDEYNDPTRSPGFERTDAQYIEEGLKVRLNRQRERDKERKAVSGDPGEATSADGSVSDA